MRRSSSLQRSLAWTAQASTLRLMLHRLDQGEAMVTPGVCPTNVTTYCSTTQLNGYVGDGLLWPRRRRRVSSRSTAAQGRRKVREALRGRGPLASPWFRSKSLPPFLPATANPAHPGAALSAVLQASYCSIKRQIAHDESLTPRSSPGGAMPACRHSRPGGSAPIWWPMAARGPSATERASGWELKGQPRHPRQAVSVICPDRDQRRLAGTH